MYLKKNYLYKIDGTLQTLSKFFCNPFLPGYCKDYFANFLSNNKKKFPVSYVGPEINFDKNKFLRNGCIRLNLKEIAIKFAPYIEKFKQSSIGKSDIYHKEYFKNILRKDICIETYNDFLSLGYNGPLVKFLSEIFGEMFFVNGGIYESPPFDKNFNRKGSQLWHIDQFSRYHLKLFINLDNVNENIGPTNVIPIEQTKKLLKYSFFRKITRKSVSKETKAGLFINHNELKEIYQNNSLSNIGDIGTSLLANTGLCLHQGSNNYSQNSRYIMLLHFCKWESYIGKQTDDITLGIKTRFHHIQSNS